MAKWAWNFCLCAVDQEKAVSNWKRAVAGPSFLLRAQKIPKWAWNFCLRAVDEEKAVMAKRARSWQYPKWYNGERLKTFRNGLGEANFCYCAVDQEKVVFKWKWAVSGPSRFGARNDRICPESLLLCCRPRKSRF